MATTQSRIIDYPNGRRQAFWEAGNGVSLVMLHGIGSAGASFQDQFDPLGQDFRILAWDAPGYGNSTPLSQGAPAAANYAAALLDFVDELKLEKFHLLGHSLGCLMAARFAKLFPARILSLSLCSIAIGHSHLAPTARETALLSRLNDVRDLGARGMAEKRGPRLLAPGADAEKVRRVIETMAAVNPAGYAQAARMLSTGDIRADVAALEPGLPVQVIYGDSDIITPPGDNELVATLMSNAKVTCVVGAGHAIYLEKPAEFNAAIKSLIDGARNEI